MPIPKRKPSLLPSSQQQANSDNTFSMKVKILNTAKTLFRKSGFSAVSINDIVGAVGITKPTLYHYFGDKENLYAEVMVEMMRIGQRYVIEGAKGKGNLKAKLYSLAAGFMAFSPTSMTAMIRDAKEHLGDIALKKVLDANAYYMVSSFELLFKEAKQNGEIREDLDTTELALIMIGLLDTYTIHKTAHGGRVFDYEKYSTTLVDILMQGIVTTPQKTQRKM